MWKAEIIAAVARIVPGAAHKPADVGPLRMLPRSRITLDRC